MRKKVLTLRAGSGFFGAENVIIELAKELARSDYQPIIGVLQDGRHPSSVELARVAQSHDIATQVFKCRGRLDIKTILAIRSFVRENQIKIVHSHDYKANFYALTGTLFGNVPLVATCHPWTAALYSSSGRWYRTLDKLLLKRFDRIAAVCDEVGKELEAGGIAAKKLSVIENGIDLRRFEGCFDKNLIREQLGIPPNKRVIGTVGRLSEEKGHKLLLQAARQLIDSFSDLFFVIVGEGPLRDSLEKTAVELGIDNHVRFLGARSDVPRILAVMDIFVLPSLSEGLPMALLEAMAAKKPVVATRVGSIPRIVDGDCGILVGGDAQDLAKGITILLSDKGRAILLAENGCKRASVGFSSQRMAKKYLAIYEQL